MPHFLLTFGDARRPPAGAVIIEAPSMFQARVTAVVRRLVPGVPFGEGLKLSANMMMAISPEEIAKMVFGKEDRQPVSTRRVPRTETPRAPIFAAWWRFVCGSARI